jgi:hypothetical protein
LPYLNSSMSTPMPSTSIRKRVPLLLVKVCVPEPIVIAVPELLHVYADALHVQVQESPPLIGQYFLPKPMAIAVPELLHVHADALYVQVEKSSLKLLPSSQDVEEALITIKR